MFLLNYMQHKLHNSEVLLPVAKDLWRWVGFPHYWWYLMGYKQITVYNSDVYPNKYSLYLKMQHII